MIGPRDLAAERNPLADHYRRFGVARRLLLSGHSHQAWPDVAWDGVAEAMDDAAEAVDGKWARAEAKAEAVRAGYARLLGDDAAGHLALGASTHELVVRFLSALPLRRRPRLVTTDGEFHALRRQLDRLAEEGVQVVRVPSRPAGEVAGALARAVDDRTAAVLCSSVFFESAHIVRGLGEVAASCARRGAALLVDAYHALNVLPVSLAGEGLADAFVVGGGYKYCQLGEGCCFLRFPAHCSMRPVVTGWFAEFCTLDEAHRPGDVRYAGGPARFAGSTYDPVSHYRGARVLRFFAEHDLTPARLRALYRHQIAVLTGAFDALDADPALVTRDRDVPLDEVAGFLALKSPRADALHRGLAERGVLCDHRGEVLRLGPAPYLTDRQLRDAVTALGEVIADTSTRS